MGRSEEWRQARMTEIENSKKLPQQGRVPILGDIVRAGYPDMGMPPNEIQLYVAAKARAELLAIRGHAEYYRDRILNARLQYETAPPDDKGSRLCDLDNEQMYGFRTLSQLPSVETVRVLGEFLADDRGADSGPGPPPRKTGEGFPLEHPNSSQAMTALHTLPLVTKPVANKHVYSADLEAYRKWYAQIKAGTRTFRFEGDPQEYDLQGPVSTVKLRRIAENRLRDEKRAVGVRTAAEAASAESVASPPGTTATLPAAIAACLIVIAGLRYYLRTRQCIPR